MDKAGNHFIGKQEILLRLSKVDNVHAVQHRISELYHERILPAIEKLLERHSGTDELISIPHLEIDLGRMAGPGWEDDFVEMFLLRLEEAIGSQLRNTAGTDVERIPLNTGYFQQWLFFLRQGALPWNAAHGRSEDALQRSVLDTLAGDVAALEQLRLLLSRDEKAFDRLLLQHPEAFLKDISTVYTAKDQSELVRLRKELAALPAPRPSAGKEEPAHRAGSNVVRLFWRKIITEVVIERRKLSWQELGAAFVVSLLSEEKLPHLLEHLRQVADPAKTSGAGFPALGLVVEALSKKTGMRSTGIARAESGIDSRTPAPAPLSPSEAEQGLPTSPPPVLVPEAAALQEATAREASEWPEHKTIEKQVIAPEQKTVAKKAEPTLQSVMPGMETEAARQGEAIPEDRASEDRTKPDALPASIPKAETAPKQAIAPEQKAVAEKAEPTLQSVTQGMESEGAGQGEAIPEDRAAEDRTNSDALTASVPKTETAPKQVISPEQKTAAEKAEPTSQSAAPGMGTESAGQGEAILEDRAAEEIAKPAAPPASVPKTETAPKQVIAPEQTTAAGEVEQTLHSPASGMETETAGEREAVSEVKLIEESRESAAPRPSIPKAETAPKQVIAPEQKVVAEKAEPALQSAAPGMETEAAGQHKAIPEDRAEEESAEPAAHPAFVPKKTETTEKQVIALEQKTASGKKEQTSHRPATGLETKSAWQEEAKPEDKATEESAEPAAHPDSVPKAETAPQQVIAPEQKALAEKAEPTLQPLAPGSETEAAGQGNSKPEDRVAEESAKPATPPASVPKTETAPKQVIAPEQKAVAEKAESTLQSVAPGMEAEVAGQEKIIPEDKAAEESAEPAHLPTFGPETGTIPADAVPQEQTTAAGDAEQTPPLLAPPLSIAEADKITPAENTATEPGAEFAREDAQVRSEPPAEAAGDAQWSDLPEARPDPGTIDNRYAAYLEAVANLYRSGAQPPSFSSEPQPGAGGKKDRTPTRAAEDIEAGTALFIRHAGMVLLHPFLSNYFRAVGLLEGKDFKDEASRHRAVHLLHYLASKETGLPEYALLLPKMLCAIPFDLPIERYIELTATEMEEGENLLAVVIEHWGALGKTSPDGLREGFLQREGKLEKRESGWYLTVEKHTADILMGRLPWGLSMVKFPWMKEILRVEWG